MPGGRALAGAPLGRQITGHFLFVTIYYSAVWHLKISNCQSAWCVGKGLVGKYSCFLFLAVFIIIVGSFGSAVVLAPIPREVFGEQRLFLILILRCLDIKTAQTEWGTPSRGGEV